MDEYIDSQSLHYQNYDNMRICKRTTNSTNVLTTTRQQLQRPLKFVPTAKLPLDNNQVIND